MASQAATLDDLLAEMHEKTSVLGGWDVVLNLPEDSVNKFVQSQWTSLAPAGVDRVTVAYCDEIQDLQGEPHAGVTQFDFALGAPIVQLQGSQQSLTVRWNVLNAQVKAGTIKVDRSLNPADLRLEANDPNVSWNAPENAGLSHDAHVAGTVPLSIVPGVVAADSHSVVLDFSSGADALHNVSGGQLNQPAIRDQLRQRFADNLHRFVVASVDFGDHANLASLRPRSLKLNTMQSIGGNKVLQLFIATSGSPPESASINVTEPVPAASGSQYSLMISSKVVIRDIIVDGYNRGTGLVKLVAVAPEASGKAWYAQTRNPMQYQGTISWGSVFPEIKKQAELGMNFVGSLADGLAVSPYTSPSSNVNLRLGVSASHPLKLSGDGRQIQLTAGPRSVSATGLAENAVKPQLEKFLNEDIKNDMTAISFAPVSTFAQKNLVFPGHVHRMQQAHLPGDLLIVGTFEEVSR